MYHTWFFQKRLARDLHDRLKGMVLCACFSQQKDELVMSFVNDRDELHLQADMSSQAGLISFRDAFARTRRNSVDLFQELIDQQVSAVRSFDFDRSFYVAFDNGLQLIFKMHGSRCNILLANPKKVLKIFRNNLPADKELTPESLSQNPPINAEWIKKLLGKKNQQYLPDQPFDAQAFIEQTDKNPISVGLKDELPYLTITAQNEDFTTQNAIEAANKYAELHYRYYQLGKQKQLIISNIRKNIKQSENYIKKTEQKLKEVTRQRDPAEIANILMANLHEIRQGQKQATLLDFYSNNEINIKLNPTLTPQKNAENYYRKSKNKQIELDKLQENITHKKQQLTQQQEELEKIKNIDNWKELKRYVQTEKPVNESSNLPYHKHHIEGFEVLVGKNAKANDQLLKIANKDDMWLHARDVAGSHVVIRNRPGQNFPDPIIEQAASIAAWYSKRKTDSLCPVIYTPRKFVRKVKGSAAGQVHVDREQVVMVEPKA